MSMVTILDVFLDLLAWQWYVYEETYVYSVKMDKRFHFFLQREQVLVLDEFPYVVA